MFDDSFKIRYKDAPIFTWTPTSNKRTANFHNHSEFEIMYVLEGEGEATVNNQTYSIRPGDMIFVNPFEIHSLILYGEAHPLLHCACFNCSLINDNEIAKKLLSKQLRIVNHISSQNPIVAELQSFQESVYKCHKENGSFVEMEASAYLSLMFACLLKNNLIADKHRETKNEKFSTEVLQYIREHYSQNITSKDISAALSYNQSYFCRMFKTCFGRQFNDYLNMYRVVEAKKRIQYENLSIMQVAFECGFNGPSYFAKCFKRYVGMLPSEYRKVDSDS